MPTIRECFLKRWEWFFNVFSKRYANDLRMLSIAFGNGFQTLFQNVFANDLRMLSTALRMIFQRVENVCQRILNGPKCVLNETLISVSPVIANRVTYSNSHYLFIIQLSIYK